MYPKLIEFGETFFLPTYGLLFASAVLIGWLWFTRRAVSLGLDNDRVFNLLFYTIVAGLLGAKLLMVLVEFQTIRADIAELWRLLRSGGVLLGGVIVGASTFFLYARRSGMPVWTLLDALAAPLILAQGIGRLGCFAAGCCWGRHVHEEHPLAVHFHRAETGVPLDTPLFPVQLFEAGFDLALASVLTWQWRRRGALAEGSIWWLYVAIYGVGRIVLEFYRGDGVRGLWLGGHVSTSQALSVFAVLLALVMLWRGRRS